MCGPCLSFTQRSRQADKVRGACPPFWQEKVVLIILKNVWKNGAKKEFREVCVVASDFSRFNSSWHVSQGGARRRRIGGPGLDICGITGSGAPSK